MFYLTYPIAVLTALVASYFFVTNCPVLSLYVYTGGAFAIGVRYLVSVIQEYHKGIVNTVLNTLCSAYLWWLFYNFLSAIDRHLQGLPIISENPAPFSKVLLWGLGGVTAGFIIFALMVQIEKYADRKRLRRELAEQRRRHAAIIAGL